MIDENEIKEMRNERKNGVWKGKKMVRFRDLHLDTGPTYRSIKLTGNALIFHMGAQGQAHYFLIHWTYSLPYQQRYSSTNYL